CGSSSESEGIKGIQGIKGIRGIQKESSAPVCGGSSPVIRHSLDSSNSFDSLFLLDSPQGMSTPLTARSFSSARLGPRYRWRSESKYHDVRAAATPRIVLPESSLGGMTRIRHINTVQAMASKFTA